MTKKELQELKVGTLLYNGKTEGIVRMDGNVKVIDISIQICTMSNGSNDYNERPENWDILD